MNEISPYTNVNMERYKMSNLLEGKKYFSGLLNIPFI